MYLQRILKPVSELTKQLHTEVGHCNTDEIKSLLFKGADPYADHEGVTAIEKAILTRNAATLAAFINHDTQALTKAPSRPFMGQQQPQIYYLFFALRNTKNFNMNRDILTFLLDKNCLVGLSFKVALDFIREQKIEKLPVSVWLLHKLIILNQNNLEQPEVYKDILSDILSTAILEKLEEEASAISTFMARSFPDVSERISVGRIRLIMCSEKDTLQKFAQLKAFISTKTNVNDTGHYFCIGFVFAMALDANDFEFLRQWVAQDVFRELGSNSIVAGAKHVLPKSAEALDNLVRKADLVLLIDFLSFIMADTSLHTPLFYFKNFANKYLKEIGHQPPQNSTLVVKTSNSQQKAPSFSGTDVNLMLFVPNKTGQSVKTDEPKLEKKEESTSSLSPPPSIEEVISENKLLKARIKELEDKVVSLEEQIKNTSFFHLPGMKLG